MKRRNFIQAFLGTGFLTAGLLKEVQCKGGVVDYSLLDKALQKPVLRTHYFKNPIIIQKIDLLKNGKEFLVRVVSRDGAEGLAVSNPAKMRFLYPLFLQQVAPFFIGKDARQLEDLIEGVYVYKSNYKMQGLAFWVCVASLEFAILDLLGQIARVPIGELLGGVKRKKIAVYRANNHRDKTAEESVELIKKSIEETGAKAVKYKIGGRMSKNKDSLPGRTEKLIYLVRKELGDDITLYADSNGSYDPPEAIRIGRMLEETRVSFFEEPCPFDHYEDTKIVADTLDIPIAGGEQESSLYRFRWMIHTNTLQVVQPDLFYFGGMIRSMRVANMAATVGIPCTPHISGGGLGYVYMLHFASCVPDPGPYQEYKGETSIPFTCDSSTLQSEKGVVQVPSGPGLGLKIDRNFIRKAKIVKG